MAKNRGPKTNVSTNPEDTSFDPAELDREEENGPPDGFDIDAELVRADGWAVKGEGNVVQGRLTGYGSFKGSDGKTRGFYTIQLAKPAIAIIGKGDDALEGELVKGQLCNVDDSAALGNLESRAKDGGVYDVWIRYGAKERIKGSTNSFWPAEVKLRMVKPPERRD